MVLLCVFVEGLGNGIGFQFGYFEGKRRLAPGKERAENPFLFLSKAIAAGISDMHKMDVCFKCAIKFEQLRYHSLVGSFVMTGV